jgi:hypothetical protein
MQIVDLIHSHIDRLHGVLEDSIADLTKEQLHWRPSSGCNHIAFSIWHLVRTEDNLVRFILQRRRPTVWIEGGWHEWFDLDRISQGTGLSEEEAVSIELPSVEAFLPYMKNVWASTDEYINSIDDSILDQVFNIRPLGDRSIGQIFFEMLLTHGFSHLGEIWVLKGLQGFKGSPI